MVAVAEKKEAQGALTQVDNPFTLVNEANVGASATSERERRVELAASYLAPLSDSNGNSAQTSLLQPAKPASDPVTQVVESLADRLVKDFKSFTTGMSGPAIAAQINLFGDKASIADVLAFAVTQTATVAAKLVADEQVSQIAEVPNNRMLRALPNHVSESHSGGFALELLKAHARSERSLSLRAAA